MCVPNMPNPSWNGPHGCWEPGCPPKARPPSKAPAFPKKIKGSRNGKAMAFCIRRRTKPRPTKELSTERFCRHTSCLSYHRKRQPNPSFPQPGAPTTQADLWMAEVYVRIGPFCCPVKPTRTCRCARQVMARDLATLQGTSLWKATRKQPCKGFGLGATAAKAVNDVENGTTNSCTPHTGRAI